jgi:hypothetical protein
LSKIIEPSADSETDKGVQVIQQGEENLEWNRSDDIGFIKNKSMAPIEGRLYFRSDLLKQFLE